MNKHPSQAEFIMAHFKEYPNQALALDDWSDEVSRQYKERTGKTAYHLRTIVRRLYWDGKLARVKRGVYKYDPDAVHKPRTLRFTPKQKREIRERDEYRCVVCGRGRAEGVRLYVDFLMPNLPNRATIENGATFCTWHSPSRNNLTFMDMIMMGFKQIPDLAKHGEYTEMQGFASEVSDICENMVSKI